MTTQWNYGTIIEDREEHAMNTVLHPTPVADAGVKRVVFAGSSSVYGTSGIGEPGR